MQSVQDIEYQDVIPWVLFPTNAYMGEQSIITKKQSYDRSSVRYKAERKISFKYFENHHQRDNNT